MPRHLLQHPEEISIVRLPGGTTPDFPVAGGPFVAVVTTADETAVVCRTSAVPAGLTQEGPFRLIEVAGPLSFGSVGVLADLVAPLVASGVSILAYSTFDTDWLLVPAERLGDAVVAWRQAGMFVTTTSLTPGGNE